MKFTCEKNTLQDAVSVCLHAVAAKSSIAVLEGEGMCAALLPHADVMVRSIAEGLDILLKPDRLRADLRT